MAKPLFIPSENLKECISRLERSELEGKVLPYVSMDPYLRSSNFVKISGITRHEGDQSDKNTEYEQRMRDLITGLYGENVPFVYFILGKENRIEIYFGTLNPSPDNRDFLPRLLKGVFKGILVKGAENPKCVLSGLHLNHGAMVTGIPTDKLDKKEKEADQIDWLIRGLMGEQWAYIITAVPIDLFSITATYEVVSNEIRNTKNKFLRSHTIEEQNNPFAQYYVSLLEVSLKKYRLGRAVGMWMQRAYLFTGSKEAMVKGKSVIRAAFSGKDSAPHALRIHDLTPSEGGEKIDIPVTILNTSDLSIFTRLPKNEFQGYLVRPGSRFEVSFPSSPIGEPVGLGTIMDGDEPTGNRFEVDLKELSKHTFVSGVTGSGKTNTCFSILHQLWKIYKRPFLVIEPSMKREYRVLYKDIDDLLVFTIGDEKVAPFRYNIFKPQGGIGLQTHIDYLRSLFLASFALYPPMPYVLDNALHQVYVNRGWDLATGTNERGEGDLAYPTLTDLYQEIEKIVDGLGYDEEVSRNVKAGLKTRINNLRIGGKGMMLDIPEGVSIKELLEKPTVLELASIGDDEEKAFIIGAILMGICEFHQSQPRAKVNDLSHLTVIEEAHRLLRNTSQDQSDPEVANIRGKALETFCNMLSEIRAFGEGIIIVDQIPSKLAPDVVKNTSLKVIHRIVARDDRELIGASMNLSEEQKRRLSTLMAGEAVAYREGLDGSFLLNMPKWRMEGSSSTSKDLKSHMEDRFYGSRPNLLLFQSGCGGCPSISSCASINRRVQPLLENYSVREAFFRFFLSVLEGEGVGRKGYREFAETVSRLGGHRFSPEMAPRVYCTGAQLLEMSMQERGRIFSWKFAVLKDSISRFLVVLGSLSKEEAAIEDRIVEFKNPYTKICREGVGPGVYCESCVKACLYLLEVKGVLCNPSFNAALEDGIGRTQDSGLWEFLAEMCKKAAYMLSVSGDPLILRDLSLCAASLLGISKNYPFYEQKRMFENIVRIVEGD
jgi:hypothetical protein